MKFKYILFSFVFIGGLSMMDAQEMDDAETSNVDVLGSRDANLNLINSGFSMANNIKATSQNTVFIQQIGPGNQIDSYVNSPDSRVDLKQKGEGNTISLNLTADKIREQLVQNGDNNTIIHDVPNTAIPINVKITQEGDNHSIDTYGINNMTKDMQIKQTQNSPDVIVRSFE